MEDFLQFFLMKFLKGNNFLRNYFLYLAKEVEQSFMKQFLVNRKNIKYSLWKKT